MATEHHHIAVVETDKNRRSVAFEIGGPPTRLAGRVDYDSVSWAERSRPTASRRSWDIAAAIAEPDIYDRFARLMSFHIRDI